MLRKPKHKLRVLRAECEISQRDLALEAGISKDRYWRIENGYEQPTPSERARLAKVLRVKTEALGFTPLLNEATEQAS